MELNVLRVEFLTGVGNEVEARELVPLLLEVPLQTLLALLQLRVHHLVFVRYSVRRLRGQ